MKRRPVQYFSKEYLKKCQSMTPDQIIEFLENFRTLMYRDDEQFKIKQMPYDQEEKKD